ncbi:glutamine--tRNA ligase/YqeY domain fusion protein [Petroclostridium sp. X23]|uniref:glutamine--tRNA ligase/YqeY domain fusion protein n=1 Tax=Petroclostridium sp. X23 TaxID=3045146 RepID=UPI0024ACC81A|nr:glutamine--tRNA ligase/YqeY domain fusion protein [Petroclostridium sp. X23]WHH57568.1 glutamine--tRNA ligase/YqeY domain fusion protein [Petroclostridium sp. X23]
MTNNIANEMNKDVQSANFIHNIIDKDLAEGVYDNVHTRFPPEPNGYLHIGHAKSICLNFGTAKKYKGLCNLRFDDTNPIKEDIEYIESIKKDVKWLGFDWEDRMFYASDYFEKLYDCAVQLIKKGKAYVCDLTAEEIRQYRGTLTEVGKESPYRNRSVEENLDLFTRMRNGEFNDGTRVLRAKIDMASPNINMRDPVIYRISHTHHHRTGDEWCIYPMYDYAHPISDALEDITHSICTLEFEDHRPLYDWVLQELEFENPPKQIEFARLDLTYTVMSKRKLRKLVEEKYVDGWDDPRMPTISGLRRRGYTPEAIKDFCDKIGVAKRISTVDIQLLEHCIREDLKMKKARMMAVLKPLKVVITNYPEGQIEYMNAENNQENPEMGSRKIPFSREIYIEQDDFMENPPKKFFRLFPGNEVRLMNAYFVKCEEVVKDEKTGEIIELRCTYDPETKSGSGFTGRKVKGTIHWVSAAHAVKAEVRLYDHLFLEENEDSEATLMDGMNLNPKSLEVLESYVEPALAEAAAEEKFQFVRNGYFCVDSKDHTVDRPVFNRVVSLKSSYKPE